MGMVEGRWILQCVVREALDTRYQTGRCVERCVEPQFFTRKNPLIKKKLKVGLHTGGCGINDEHSLQTIQSSMIYHLISAALHEICNCICFLVQFVVGWRGIYLAFYGR